MSVIILSWDAKLCLKDAVQSKKSNDPVSNFLVERGESSQISNVRFLVANFGDWTSGGVVEENSVRDNSQRGKTFRGHIKF